MLSATSTLFQIIATQFLPAATTVLYVADTNPPNTIVRVSSILLANQSTSNVVTVTLNNVPYQGVSGSNNIIVPAIQVPAASLIVIAYEAGLFVLPAGGCISGSASMSTMVTITAHGIKY